MYETQLPSVCQPIEKPWPLNMRAWIALLPGEKARSLVSC